MGRPGMPCVTSVSTSTLLLLPLHHFPYFVFCSAFPSIRHKRRYKSYYAASWMPLRHFCCYVHHLQHCLYLFGKFLRRYKSYVVIGSVLMRCLFCSTAIICGRLPKPMQNCVVLPAYNLLILGCLRSHVWFWSACYYFHAVTTAFEASKMLYQDKNLFWNANSQSAQDL